MRCPDCGSTYIVRCGKRETKRGNRQQYHCNNCGKRFVYNPFPGKTYRPKVIVNSIKLYYSGYTLSETSKKINRRYKANTSSSTIHNWIDEFRDICSYSKRRKKHGDFYDPPLIESTTFYHSDLRYDFRYHIGKLEDASSYRPNVVDFIKDVPDICPHELFNKDSQEMKRASNQNLKFSARPNTYSTKNQACQLADLSLRANKNRKKRHDDVETFMLTCDGATVATELPVWYYDKDQECSITGHIDIVQIRTGKIYLLDYKPKAEKRSPFSQLYAYSKAFSYRTETPLKKIRAAWFDENTYIQFSPSEVR